jgi:hypothetical protein
MKFTRIKGGFSENRRIPRLGKIRLGLKVQKKRPDGSIVEYPSETSHFVCPPEVEAAYGPQPKELDVMLPSDDPEVVFPQSLAWFGKSKGLKCKGDMETAERLNPETGKWFEMKCPCENLKSKENPKGECTEQGNLMFMIPKVSMGGVYQLRTGSYHSVVDINSGLDYIRALIGRIAMVPLKLRRMARDTHSDGKRQTHYTLSLTLDASVEGINYLRSDTSRILSHEQLQIEGPVEENPALDPPDIIKEGDGPEIDEHNQVDAEDLAHATDAQIEEVQKKLAAAQKAQLQDTLKPSPHAQPSSKDASTREALKPIPRGSWVDTINAIDEDPDLRDVKEKVKKDMKVPSLLHEKLTAPGQHEFFRRFREKATADGYGDRVKKLFTA